ncbi:DNA-binding protein [Celeribacter ethanolicus]|uniref:DNA-binding protein n=1 Tax=Celeribacter ethanolicus TaxID=1758178 RepID=A0A291GE33_9RHOB|nr:helix-turn-helix domain-containing protein [Celeribacter ethanolicus]ATG48284.1 DNA-binding protein [Celeribacter ethanolicus]
MPEIKNRHEWLKAALRERGSSFSQIARELGVGPSSVVHAAKRRHVSKRIETAIAERLSKDIEEIWGEAREQTQEATQS